MTVARKSENFDEFRNPSNAQNSSETKIAPFMSREDLPSPKTKRWVSSRKAAVVNGIRTGLLTKEEACRTYSLTLEELESWEKAISKHGMKGLMATKLQDFRD